MLDGLGVRGIAERSKLRFCVRLAERTDGYGITVVETRTLKTSWDSADVWSAWSRNILPKLQHVSHLLAEGVDGVQKGCSRHRESKACKCQADLKVAILGLDRGHAADALHSRQKTSC